MKKIVMPPGGQTTDVSTIDRWLKKIGDSVKIGEVLLEVQTDKAVLAVESYASGTLLEIYYEEGSEVEEGQPIALVGNPEELVKSKQKIIERDETQKTVKKEIYHHLLENTKDPENKIFDTQIKIMPNAKKMINEKGLDLHKVALGRNGQLITRKDIQKYLDKLHDEATPHSFGLSPSKRKQLLRDKMPVDTDVRYLREMTEKHILEDDSENFVPWHGTRKVIAEKMHQSTSVIPHVTMYSEVDMRAVIEFRNQVLPIIEKQINHRISYLEIIMKAVAALLPTHFHFNATTSEKGIHFHRNINIGFAVSISDGLLVPVVKNTNQFGLLEMTKKVKELTAKARSGMLTQDEMIDGTFTITSLGRTRVQSFNPIIKTPEVAILGIGGLYEKPQFKENGEMGIIPSITVCLSFDHRVVDGTPAAVFLTDLVELLESPMNLFL